MISEYMEVGKFLPHWQTGVLLTVALIAGTIAYKARVGHAREKHNESSKRAESGILAHETLRIARQVEGILAAVIANIDATAKLADTLIFNAQDTAIRQRVASPPLFSTVPRLDKLRPEITKTYLQLCDGISDFRTETSQTSTDRLQNELGALREIVQILRSEISESRDQAQSVLAATPRASEVPEVVAQSA
jgi:hypothetical protein